MAKLKKHTFTIRTVTKVAISVFLVASVVLGVANILKPSPTFTDNSYETTIKMQKLSSVATVFAQEFYTFSPGDTTWAKRVEPYTSSPFQITGKISLEGVTVTQTVKRVWLDRIDYLVGNVYNVSLGVVTSVKDAEGKTNPRYMSVVVPVELIGEDQRAFVIGSPAISAQKAEVKGSGIKIPGNQLTSEEVVNVQITIKNFMEKLVANSSISDLRNFTDGNFVPKSLGDQVAFLDFKSFAVYVGAQDAQGNTLDYIALADVTLKDKTTGQIYTPTYAYRFVVKEGKYYITWMSNE